MNNTNNLKKKSRLNPKNIRSLHQKLITSNQDSEPQYCSQQCQDRSDHYLHSILKKLSPCSDILSSNNNKRLTNDHHRTIEPEKILLLEELDRLVVEDSNADDEQLQLEQSGISSSQKQREYDHDFLQPFLTQIQSSLQMNDKRIDQNLNPIFSSIKIIEHAPKELTSSSDPHLPDSSDHLNQLEHQVLNQCSTFQQSSSRTKNNNHNPIHELSSSLTQTLSSQVILSNSNPGTYNKRRLDNETSGQPLCSLQPPDSNTSPLVESAQGALEAQIIYNVGSLEDQLAIDQAMALRDQLELNPSHP